MKTFKELLESIKADKSKDFDDMGNRLHRVSHGAHIVGHVSKYEDGGWGWQHYHAHDSGQPDEEGDADTKSGATKALKAHHDKHGFSGK